MEIYHYNISISYEDRDTYGMYSNYDGKNLDLD